MTILKHRRRYTWSILLPPVLASLILMGESNLRDTWAQPYGEPDQGGPGDGMIQKYLQLESQKIEQDFPGAIKTAVDWTNARTRYYNEYLEMLGISPLPEKTPLKATITRKLERGDYSVEMLHYQSQPGLYITANLYRGTNQEQGKRLPAILYVCGHAPRGRDGNKTAYQSNGIWFARHGYICLVVDTLQLGEIAGTHHGTYREGRWWWLSRGYTPAGVECWNGIRGIDYLVSRPDVDPQRIAVTGISGGGAATIWIAAADDRVNVAIPVSGMSDLLSYVPNRVVNGHCDCMFLYNTYQWPWARIAGLIAPRPLLFVNSDQDSIFPMDGNERVINRLKRVYSLFGASDDVESVVSMGGHAYRKDIRTAVFRFSNTHLKNDPRPIQDSEVDLVTGATPAAHPISPEELRVFPLDTDIPRDSLNSEIDQHFVPIAKVGPPPADQFQTWKTQQLAKLRRMTFHHFPERIPPARPGAALSAGAQTIETEPGIFLPLSALVVPKGTPKKVWLVPATSDDHQSIPGWLREYVRAEDAVYGVEPRGTGSTHWTQKNPPNYVERAHYLLGRTVGSGQVWDVTAATRLLCERYGKQVPVTLAGEGGAAILALYAAALEPDVAGLLLFHPPLSHMDSSCPPLLNVLRVSDVPESLGALAPLSVTVVGTPAPWAERVVRFYHEAGAAGNITVRE